MPIRFDKNNYRKHGAKNKAIIRKSLSDLGAGRSVLLDAEDSLIAGNGVYEQAKALGIPVRVVETDGTELIAVKRTDVHEDDRKRSLLALADNTAGDTSEMDLPKLTADFETGTLAEWGVELGELSTDDEQKPSTDNPKQRAKSRQLHWGTQRGDKDEARCNMVEKVQLHFRDGRAYLSTYNYSPEGVKLSEIKAEGQVDLFADNAAKIITSVLGTANAEDMCIVTTPRRRHNDWNFADEVCKAIEQRTGIHYEPDVMRAKNRHRIGCEFELIKKPPQSTIILYDDIVTTGSTIIAAWKLLQDKNVLTVIGICNLKTLRRARPFRLPWLRVWCRPFHGFCHPKTPALYLLRLRLGGYA